MRQKNILLPGLSKFYLCMSCFWWTGGLNGNVRRIPYVFAIQVKHEVNIKKFLVEAY